MSDDPFLNGCPDCGSMSIHRVEGLSRDAVDYPSQVDMLRSGVYMCGRCEYEAVAVYPLADRPKTPIYPGWSRVPQCEHCKSWDTRSLQILPEKNVRIYRCCACKKRTWTNMIERGRPSTVAGYPDYSPTARCSCGSYDTRLTGADTVNWTRSHSCRKCGKAFKTSILER